MAAAAVTARAGAAPAPTAGRIAARRPRRLLPDAAALTTAPALARTDFDRTADEYDDSLPAHVAEHYLRKRLAFIRQHVSPGPALDVGCGTGRLAERLADAGYPVVGVDPSPGMLAV